MSEADVIQPGTREVVAYAARGAVGSVDDAPKYPVWLSRLCAFVPMGVGVVTTILWVLFSWRQLQVVGMMTIFGGLILAGMGVIAIIVHAVQLVRRRVAGPTVVRRAILLLLPIALNVPLAAACIQVVVWFPAWHTVSITNKTGQPLSKMVIVYPGGTVNVSTLPDGESRSHSFRVGQSGPIYLALDLGSSSNLMATAEPYSSEMGGAVKTELTITAGGYSTPGTPLKPFESSAPNVTR